jgi:hypothetical protein
MEEIRRLRRDLQTKHNEATQLKLHIDILQAKLVTNKMKSRISSDRQQNQREEDEDDQREVCKDRKKMEWKEILQESKNSRDIAEESIAVNNREKKRTSKNRDSNEGNIVFKSASTSNNPPATTTTKYHDHIGRNHISPETTKFHSETIETIDHFLHTEAFEQALDLDVQQHSLLVTPFKTSAATTLTFLHPQVSPESKNQHGLDGFLEKNKSTNPVNSSNLGSQELKPSSDKTADKVREIISNQSYPTNHGHETAYNFRSSIYDQSPQRARKSYFDDNCSDIQDQSLLSLPVSSNLKTSRLQQIYDKVTNKGKDYISK